MFVCEQNLYQKRTPVFIKQIVDYSVLKFLVGFTIAALTALIPKVNDVITRAINPAKANIHHCMEMLNAKLFNQEVIKYAANGKAIMAAIPTKII